MKASLLFAGMMLAGMTFVVHAAKPELTGQQKKEIAAKVAANMKKAPPQAKTLEQSNATTFRTPQGAVGQQLATELWSTLSAQADANGQLRVVEHAGDGSEAAKATEGLPNE